jgi:aryl-alcohol dehydrogenase-like predicted oxidoreductase
MQKIMLGKTGLEVTRAAFGGIICMDELQSDADRYVSFAADAGINYFDVAPSYGNAEERLGPALRPYRGGAVLACKTTERTAKGARKELESSLKNLQTDYFDIYQMHALGDSEDIRQIFAEDGALKTFIDAKKEGLIRHIGITAHSEDIALEALSKYSFDTVMFPVNWALHMGGILGTRLPEECRRRQIGLVGIKALAHRKWHEDEERAYPKSWCKTIYNDDRLGICALKYALYRGVDSLIPPGNFEQFCFVLKHIDECIANPLNEEDIQYLKASMPGDNEHIFIISENGRKSRSNN